MDELAEKNKQLNIELVKAEKNCAFWMQKSADALAQKQQSKKDLRTALFSCYLGGLACTAALFGGKLYQIGSVLDFLKWYGGLLVIGLLGSLGIGFVAFSVADFFFAEEKLPFWLWSLFILIPPLLILFFNFL